MASITDKKSKKKKRGGGHTSAPEPVDAAIHSAKELLESNCQYTPLLDDAGQPVHSDEYEKEFPKRGKTGYPYCVDGGGRCGPGVKVQGKYKDFGARTVKTVPNSRFDWTDAGIRQCVAANDAFFAAQYAKDGDDRWLGMIVFKTVDGAEVRPPRRIRVRDSATGARPMCAFGRTA